MTVDLVGIAAIIAVIGSPLTVIFTQINAMRKYRDDLAAAAEAIKAAAKRDADEHLKILNEQTGTLARVEGNTDGALSEAKAIAKKLGVQKDAMAVEVERLQPSSQEPTPQGPPTAEQPVGMVGGRAKAFDPAAPKITPPATDPVKPMQHVEDNTP